MKEQGPRKSARERLKDKYAAYAEPIKQEGALFRQTSARFNATRPSKETVDATRELINKTSAHSIKLADHNWLEAMTTIPGMTDEMRLAIWEAKDKVAAKYDQPATDTPTDTQPSQESPQDPLAALSESWTPQEELTVIYDETYDKAMNTWQGYQNAKETLRSTIPTEETAEAADTATDARRQFAEAATDTLWIRALSQHPFISNKTATEVWDAKHESRQKYDEDFIDHTDK